jgi:alpha-beta hydrolase superfamily lysophospholipase
MYKRSEGFFKGYDSARLFFQIWENPQAKGTIIINHGQGEHSDCYQRLVDFFKNDAWTFYAWDMRGHGRSDGKRGYVANFDEYGRDYSIFVEKVLSDEKRPQGPVLLLSHSMGGLVQLKTLLQKPAWLAQVAGQICSAPLLGLALPVPAFKSKGAAFLNQLMPTITMYNEIRNDMLTRDLDVVREFEQDSLRHNRISPGAFLGFLDSFQTVIPRAAEITLPTLFVLPEKDPVVSTPASRAFFENLGSSHKEIYIYPDARHEMFNDIHRLTVYQDVKKFTDSFLGAP